MLGGERVGTGGHLESDIRERLRAGERILNMLVVVRRTSPRRRPRRPRPGEPSPAPTGDPALLAIRYVVYLRVTWRVGYRILRTFRNREDRTFRDFNRLMLFVEEELGYTEPLLVVRSRSRGLRQYRGLQPEDRYAGDPGQDAAERDDETVALPSTEDN